MPEGLLGWDCRHDSAGQVHASHTLLVLTWDYKLNQQSQSPLVVFESEA
jgi:hypothetical protein